MTTVIAPIAGPILGGVLCDTYSWPWVFYINVPIGMIVCFLSWRTLKGHETFVRKLPVDLVGLVIMVMWIAALQILLDKGEELDWFQSPTIIVLGLVAVIGFVAFLIWELTEPNPVVNLKVFRSSNYTIALLIMCLCFSGYFAAVVILPLWLQTNLNFTATWAGFAMAPAGVFAVIMFTHRGAADGAGGPAPAYLHRGRGGWRAPSSGERASRPTSTSPTSSCRSWCRACS